jgi:hypothetical protein
MQHQRELSHTATSYYAPVRAALLKHLYRRLIATRPAHVAFMTYKNIRRGSDLHISRYTHQLLAAGINICYSVVRIINQLIGDH